MFGIAPQYRRQLDVPISAFTVNPLDFTGPGTDGTYVAERRNQNAQVLFTGHSGAIYAGYVSLGAPMLLYSLNSWVVGYLAKHLYDAVMTRVAAAGTFASSKQLMYSTQDHDTPNYVRNSALWATGWDFTGCSPWNSYDQNHRAGTMVSPRHFIHATHYTIANGTSIRFIEANGTVHTRTVVSTVSIGAYDIQLGVLDSDLPASITYYKVLPSNWRTWFANLNLGINAITLDQEEKVLAHTVGNGQFPSIQYAGFPLGAEAWAEELISGDSGNPVFLPINGELILVTTHLTAGSGPDISGFATEINTQMLAMGGGYQLSVVDLSGFPVP